jgi:hypothetical protein
VASEEFDSSRRYFIQQKTGKGGFMKIVVTRLVACILIIQVFIMPVMTVRVYAAPPFDSFESLSSRTNSGFSGDKTEGVLLSPDKAEGYFVDGNGNILMNINVWGNVHTPGQVVVPEGSNLSTLISMAGGPAGNYNLKKVRINRAYPDEHGKMTYLVDMEKYITSGDRSTLIDLQPNDTVIIPDSKALDFGTILGIVGIALSIYTISTN